MPEKENAALLRAEMDKQGITDNVLRAGIAAIVGGESGWIPHTETPYTHTSNDRIRLIFKTAFAGKDDQFIDEVKADPVVFFNYVYGPRGAGNQLGNINPDDGYKFRGRGGAQLTGRSNYTKLGELTGLNLVDDPDLVNQPENSAAVTVGYMRWRYRGGGWQAIKAAVGNSFGDVDARKNALFAQYQRTGEFNSGAMPKAAEQEPPREAAKSLTGTGELRSALDRMKAIQAILLEGGEYKDRRTGKPGEIDGKYGGDSEAAINQLAAEAWAEIRNAG
jgi:predicted chitinase